MPANPSNGPDPEESPPPVLLASASPRRRELLAQLGVNFTIGPVDVSEVVLPGESPRGAAKRLAVLKLESGLQAAPDHLVIASDTVVEVDGETLGKPHGAEDASTMLRRLRGREHLVHTAVTVGRGAFRASSTSTTVVRMRAYDDDELDRYVATGDPMDKAGAYAIQDAEFRPVASISGLYSNVVGLPLGPTARLLSLAGLFVRFDAEQERLDTWPAQDE